MLIRSSFCFISDNSFLLHTLSIYWFFYHILLVYFYFSSFYSISRHNLVSCNFLLDVVSSIRYTFHLRPGGGTADTSVSKTDAARCAGSNPAPGTIYKLFGSYATHHKPESSPKAAFLLQVFFLIPRGYSYHDTDQSPEDSTSSIAYDLFGTLPEYDPISFTSKSILPVESETPRTTKLCSPE